MQSLRDSCIYGLSVIPALRTGGVDTLREAIVAERHHLIIPVQRAGGIKC